jgi:tyrosyl-tRNA synthetase
MAQECLPKLGYAKRAHMMNPMVPGLAGGKMSSSDPNSKIDFLDSAADVKKKIKAAFCEEKNITDNGILSFHKAVLFPLQTMRIAQLVERGENATSAEHRNKLFISPNAPDDTLLSIVRDEKFGGPVHYQTFQQMEDEFASGALHPGDLKKITTELINDLLEPVRKVFAEDKAFQDAEKSAYPPPPPPQKFVKKSKVSRTQVCRCVSELPLNLALDRRTQQDKKKEKDQQAGTAPNAESFIAQQKDAIASTEAAKVSSKLHIVITIARGTQPDSI